ncbi:interleukin-32 isoform X2 [Cynocephalus volans]|uniref:interleukin-32 isoform X2 n=1 Tax=Cynocephalus volans TaxID=110931 RepID=UPI002FC94FB0
MGYSKVKTVLTELQASINKTLLDVIGSQYQRNNPDLTPVPPDVWQGLRCRVQGHSDPFLEDDGPGVLDPEEKDDHFENLRVCLKSGVDKFINRIKSSSPACEKMMSRSAEVKIFCDKVLKCFQVMLDRVMNVWQDALAWLLEKVAAGFRALYRAMEAVLSILRSFCYSVTELFPLSIKA